MEDQCYTNPSSVLEGNQPEEQNFTDESAAAGEKVPGKLLTMGGTSGRSRIWWRSEVYKSRSRKTL